MKPVRPQRVRVTSLRMGTATRPPACSAASSLGVAGLILAFGADILWYPVEYTADYLALLALVASHCA